MSRPALHRVSLDAEVVGGLPLLHAAPEALRHLPLPTVFLYHGFTSSKELYSYLAFMLAQAGFRVIVPEALLHGSRFDGDENGRTRRFWDILKSSIDELPQLHTHYVQGGLVDAGRVGVMGASMGGYTALACLVRYPWLRLACSFMGSAYFRDSSRHLYPPLGEVNAGNAAEHERRMHSLAAYEPSAQLDKLGNRPLMLWHGGQDDRVPFSESERLMADLTARDLAQQVQFIPEAPAGHKISVAAAEAGVAFFAKNL